VCQALLQQAGQNPSSPGSAVATHTKAQAIDVVKSSLTQSFQTGTFDAYFALLNGTPTWVVEDNNLQQVTQVGPPTAPQTVVWHHYIDFVDDSTLTDERDGGSCP
jgi:hypothetical protein